MLPLDVEVRAEGREALLELRVEFAPPGPPLRVKLGEPLLELGVAASPARSEETCLGDATTTELAETAFTL
ncbi:MAG: hypothetical protein ACREMM_10360 [Gemmatimonadales bacterium]